MSGCYLQMWGVEGKLENMTLLEFCFEDMVKSLRTAIGSFPDRRKGKNQQYTMMDAAAGAFSVFFTQCPSFLAHQQLLQEKYGLSNAQTLFGMEQIPTDPHIRSMLDGVSPQRLTPVFTACLQFLKDHGDLEKFQTTIGNNDFLVALDGTWYFSSDTIHCKKCSTKTRDGKKTYYHGMINPAIVAPGRKQAIALPPEYIIPQDGDKKQDCEIKAGKRWLKKRRKDYEGMNITILGDDLYCHQPMVEAIREAGYNFILVCKPDSHPVLYEWLKGIMEEKHLRRRNGKYFDMVTYRWASGVPLKDGENALLVNWCEITVERNGKQIYRNGFVTNHAITQETVSALTQAGRARWKTENENNNTLKTKGYHLEHNYGHGKKHLSSLLAVMNILAFLFHTILEMIHETYQILWDIAGARERFFDEIRLMLKYFPFRSFNNLMTFMLDCLKHPRDPFGITVPI